MSLNIHISLLPMHVLATRHDKKRNVYVGTALSGCDGRKDQVSKI